MSRTKLQIDELGGLLRLSFGEFDGDFPSRSSLVAALSYLVRQLGGWHPSRSVLVGHWSEEATMTGWRTVAAFPYRRSLFQTAAIHLSEVPAEEALASALESSWQLPRLLLCVVERTMEAEFSRLSSMEWSQALEDEASPSLLSLRQHALVLGFYHQRWICVYLPQLRAPGLVDGLRNEFGVDLVEVSDEL